MIYKLLNRIFGWDYVAWKNHADQGIARVHVDWTGRVYYWRYKSTRVTDDIAPENVRWLTCHPSKYFPERAQWKVINADGSVIEIAGSAFFTPSEAAPSAS